MDSAANDLAALYADFGSTVSRANGAPDFLAMITVEDDTVFGSATATDRQLRYQSSTTLDAGETLVIDGVAYKTTKKPPARLLDGLESVVELVLV